MKTLKAKSIPDGYYDKVQAFKALTKFYEFCDENTFSENSSCKKAIEVCTDYKNASSNKETNYENLRKVLISV
jgi:hypothetical protein